MGHERYFRYPVATLQNPSSHFGSPVVKIAGMDSYTRLVDVYPPQFDRERRDAKLAGFEFARETSALFLESGDNVGVGHQRQPSLHSPAFVNVELGADDFGALLVRSCDRGHSPPYFVLPRNTAASNA